MKIFNSLKKIGLMAVLFACGVAAKAQTVTVEPLSIAPGEEKEIAFVYTEGANIQSSFAVDIYLPEGLKFVVTKDVDEDGEEISYIARKGDALLASHDIHEADHGDFLRVAVIHLKGKAMKNGTMIYVKVAADESLADESEIKFTGVQLSSTAIENDVEIPDFTCKVTKNTSTGIEGVAAAKENAPAYNLGGQPVKKNAKGLRIEKGKKVVR